MYILCGLIQPGFAHQPMEQRQHRAVVVFENKGFGVPLHTYYGAPVGGLHCLYHAIGGNSRNGKALWHATHCLMMEGVDKEALFTEYFRKAAALIYVYPMGGHATLLCLIVVEQIVTKRGIYILMHTAPKRGGKRLNATANSQDGEPKVGGKQGEHKFLFVACGVYCVKQVVAGLLAHITRVYVGTARQQQAVEGGKQLHQSITIGIWRNYYRRAARCKHRRIVAFGKGGEAFVGLVGSDAYYGATTAHGVCFMQGGIFGLQVEFIVHSCSFIARR